jgi:hypothetical protein
MGQSDVIDFLNENQSKYFTEKEISNALDRSRCKNVLRSLRKFPPSGLDFKRIRNENNCWTFIYQMSGV